MNDMSYKFLFHRTREDVARRPGAAYSLQQSGQAQRAFGGHVGSGAVTPREGRGATTTCAWSCSPARAGRRSSPAPTSRSSRTACAKEAVKRYEQLAEAALQGIYEFDKPTIACIRGYCIGGGVNVAISCDIRVASSDSVFSIPATRLGLGYRFSAMKNLVHLVGPGIREGHFLHRPQARCGRGAAHRARQSRGGACGIGRAARRVHNCHHNRRAAHH